MMTEEIFKNIIKKQESTVLDFKSEPYKFSGNVRDDAEYIKDIISMVNTPREENSYLILGIKDYSNGDKDFLGITDFYDSSIYQAKFNSDKFSPCSPVFEYSVFEFDGLKYGIIEIPPKKYEIPMTYKESLGGTLIANQIYCRRGSVNEVANEVEKKEIARWMLNCEEKNNEFKDERIEEIETSKFLDNPLKKHFNFKLFYSSDGNMHETHKNRISKKILELSNTIIVIQNSNSFYSKVQNVFNFIEQNVNEKYIQSMKDYVKNNLDKQHEISLHSLYLESNNEHCNVGSNIFLMNFENKKELYEFLKYKIDSDFKIKIYTTLK